MATFLGNGTCLLQVLRDHGLAISSILRASRRSSPQQRPSSLKAEIRVYSISVCGGFPAKSRLRKTDRLIFAPPDKVDMIWSSIASTSTHANYAPICTDSCRHADSLVSGPLSHTSAFLAKVATSPQNDTSNYSHLMCVYMPDAYDQASVTEVW